jgi:hypothetical protein
MKPRYLIVCVLLAANANIRAGELSVIGNMNIASNLTANGYILTPESALCFVNSSDWVNAKLSSDGCWVTFQNYCGYANLLLNPEGGGVMINTPDYYLDGWGLTVGADTGISGNLYVGGKLSVSGGMDPPYLLLDSETRNSIANRVAREVPPSKQTGAALFWNAQTKQLEIYVASEGAFYGLNGKMLAAITPPSIQDAKVVRAFRIDPDSGAVVVRESVEVPRWRLKRGYRFDSKTGTFTKASTGTNAPPVAATPQEALELK